VSSLRRRTRSLTPLALVAACLAAGTIVVALLEGGGVADASAAYLLVVVLVAVLAGTWPAVVTAVGAFLAYDILFIEPRFTLTVADPQEWLNLLLLLVVGVVVGRLAGEQRARAETALAGEREARALFDVSFALASSHDTRTALEAVVRVVCREASMLRAWIQVGEAVVADSGGEGEPQVSAVHVVLGRRPGDQPAVWTRVHAPVPSGRRAGNGQPRDGRGDAVYRVAIVAGERQYGSLWTTRPRDDGAPDPGETRILAAAADQVGGSLERDRLLGDATTAEIVRRSEAIKSALLDSVSHDLRTPLAAIRAAAGTLMDPAVEWPPDERREIARTIDRDAAWLDRLVTNLLDMSRVEAGELRPDLQIHDLEGLLRGVLDRGSDELRATDLEIRMPTDLPPVLVDEVLLSQVLINVLDNAVKYAGPDPSIRVAAGRDEDGNVRMTVEDSGGGVPDEALGRLFEKFYRVPRSGQVSRRGTGIGLAVVRGLIDAMGGSVTASRSSMGGLAITMTLPAAPPLGDEPAT
jgi:two-component system sensor histidine kinase KdpD